MLGASPVGDLPLCAMPDDGWAPVIDQPTTWTPQGEPLNPWTPVD
jgi:hypothetical protein